jgi:hypothetical protein
MEISIADTNNVFHGSVTSDLLGLQAQSTTMPLWDASMFDTAIMMPLDGVSLTTPLDCGLPTTAGRPGPDGQFVPQIEDESSEFRDQAIMSSMHPSPIDFRAIGHTSHKSVGPNESQDTFTALNSAFRPSSSRQITTILQEYASLLLQDSFHTPLLHFTMYSNGTPDITLLPVTTMALACSHGLVHGEVTSFMKRAVDGEQQRLIDQYVSPMA